MAITREEATKHGLADLYDEVKCLEKLTDQQQIIKKLQDIGKKLLTEYEVKIGDFLGEPMWIEAYYYRTGVFEDTNCHKNLAQKNRFGKLYFQSGSAGIDVCLSNGDYFLSFLLKNMVIRAAKNTSDVGKLMKQYGVSDCIVDAVGQMDRDDYYLAPNSTRDINNEFPVFFALKGLVKESYCDAQLAVVKILKDFDIEKKEEKAQLYIDQNLSTKWNAMSEIDRKQWSQKLLGYERAEVWQYKTK